MSINFEFSDLEAFLAVADFGSFQRAAEQISVSQPALTRRIQKLEASLGVVLFERTTRSLKLTLAGKLLRARAQAMVDDATEAMWALKDETALYEHQRNAIVSIAVVPSATQRVLTNAINAFRARGHSARIRIIDRLANDVAETVAQGDADFGVSSIPPLDPSIRFEAMADDRFVVAFRREHELAARTKVRWEDLAGATLIAPMKGTGNRMVLDEALARERRVLNWSIEVRRTTTAVSLAGAGLGVAVLPETGVPGGADARLIARPLIEPSVSRTIGLVQREGRAISTPALAMIEILREQLRS